MTEFTPITTQEQLDEVVGELRRGYEKQLSELKRAAQADAQKYAGYDKTIADLQARVRGYETDAVRTRVALETGLPYAMAARLTGDTEGAIRKDAEALALLMRENRPNAAPPMKSGEPAGGGSKRDAMRMLSAQLETND